MACNSLLLNYGHLHVEEWHVYSRYSHVCHKAHCVRSGSLYPSKGLKSHFDQVRKVLLRDAQRKCCITKNRKPPALNLQTLNRGLGFKVTGFSSA